MITLGALILASMIVMAALIVNGIHLDNEYLKRREESRNQPWNWD